MKLPKFLSYLLAKKATDTELGLFEQAADNEIKLLTERANLTDTHLIALCRLLFIKPEILWREVNNAEANTNYFKNLIDIRNNDGRNLEKENQPPKVGETRNPQIPKNKP